MKKQRIMLGRIIISALLTGVLLIAGLEGILGTVLWLALYLFIGYDVLWKAVTGIFKGDFFDECFLMGVATVGAFALAIWGRGDCLEAVAVMLFYQTGEFFGDLAVERSRKSIGTLMSLRPEYARVVLDKEVKEVSPEEVEIGSIISVWAGERIPLDGVIVGGEASLDTSALTGESVPRFVAEGDAVLEGFVNLDGRLQIRTEKRAEESAVARILELVEQSGMRKAKTERFISRFARVYTPIVCCLALALSVVPPLASLAVGVPPMWSEWLYRALSFLVVSCPCALVVSVPLAFFSTVGNAGKNGILIKGASFIEALSRLDFVAFDKTGTVSEGKFSLSEITVAEGRRESTEEILRYAAYAEISSCHPIAKGIKEAYGKTLDPSLTEEIKELAGKGVSLRFEGKELLLGNERLLIERGIEKYKRDFCGTAVYLLLNGEYIGCIVLSDKVKASSGDAIRSLRKMGVDTAVMLTGDVAKTAEAMGEELGIDRVCSSLLPNEKAEMFEKILGEKRARQGRGGRKKKSAFVGDGINDAPLLACADVGIAMGTIGSGAAVEAADVVLMNDDLGGIAYAMARSKACMRTVRINIALSLGVKLACLLLVSFGLAGMWLAVFADVGVMLLAVLNSMLLLVGKRTEKGM